MDKIARETSRRPAMILASPSSTQAQPRDRQHVAESPALAAWRTDPAVIAQTARDNEARAVAEARRIASSRTDEDLVYDRRECLYWTMGFRNYDDDGDDATSREHYRRRFRATEREIRRRLVLLRDAVSSPDVVDGRPGRRDLVEVAQRVKEVLTVPDALVDLGFEPKRTGASRGREEWHCSCPVCGGVDRLISWGQPDSNWTCRQCREGGDVVKLAQTVLRVDFPEATRRLARLAGVAA